MREIWQGPAAGDGVFVESGVREVVGASGFGRGAGGEEGLRGPLSASQGVACVLEGAGGNGGDVLPAGKR